MNRMSMILRRRWWGLALGVLAAGGVAVEALAAKAFGGLTLTTTLTPTGVAVSSRFEGSYFTGLVADLPRSTLASIPALAENALVSTGSGFQVVLPSPGGASFVQFLGYVKQDVVMHWPVGVVGVVSDLAFSWDLSRQYLWTYAWVHYGGVALRFKMALARAHALVGAGMEVGFEGTTLRGLVFSMAHQFGLTTDRTALIRTVTLGTVGGEMFEYRGTTLEAGVFPLCCLRLDATVRLTKTGFESARIVTSYTFTLAELSVATSATLLFKTQEKTLTIIPRLTLPRTGSELYVVYSLVPARLGPSSSTLTGIQIHGVGLSSVSMGEILVSGIWSLAGNLYRRHGQDDIFLRASGYSVQPSADLIRLPYDSILSFEYNTLYANFATDFYFVPSGGHLFGLAMVTFHVEVTLLGDFRTVVGVAFASGTGWQRLVAEVNYTFTLYGL